jgi:hypothetical protein
LRFAASLALLSFGTLVASAETRAQECEDTPEGRVCRISQPIQAGVIVDTDTQRLLGLVTVNNGCSGTLLNRFWVLTARHCVTQPPPAGSPRTTNEPISNPLLPPDQVRVTADWASGTVGIAERIYDLAVNVNAFAANANAATPDIRDIVLVYLGVADLGPVDSQRIYAVARDRGNGSVVLSGRLAPADIVTQYGRGFSTFASGVFGTPTATPSSGIGVYRSAQLTPSSITNTGYTLAMNGSNQVGHGGDSGGPTVVTVNGVGVGIAGVQSTCVATGYVTGAPNNWNWATGVSSCNYESTEPYWNEFRSVTQETPDVGGTLFQRHSDGAIWKYDGKGKCTADACPGWRQIDHNPNTADIVTAGHRLFQRHVDGRIWKYDGVGRCTVAACPGWTEIDHNPRTATIAGGASRLYQKHVDGRVWKYDDNGQCTVDACPGWTEIDHNPNTADIAVASGTAFQRHTDGRIWRYNGAGQCTADACPGWDEIDHNPNTAAIAGGSGGFYQRHKDGRIWKYDGIGKCTVDACPGWTEIDHNPNTAYILASGSALYQRHADGRVWKYDRRGQCTVDACPGWTEIDHNPNTTDIAASGASLFQRHADGRIWKYDGISQCTIDACPGWTEIDHNPSTAAIAAVDP